MGAAANELHLLGQSTVIGPADADLALFLGAGGMHHHGQVHVIELAQPDQFRFAP